MAKADTLAGDLDFAGNQALNAVLQILSADPGSPADAGIWYNSTVSNGTGTGVIKFRDSSGNNITLPTTSGLASAYATISDGTTSSTASGADTVTFAASGSGLTVAVAAKTVTYTLNSGTTSGANKIVQAGGGGKISATFMTGVLAVSDLTTGTTGTGNIVLAGGPTFTGQPTIPDFTNSNHNHQNAAGGGSLTHVAISDFDSQVRSSRLDQFAVPTANVPFNTQRITGLGDPVSAQDAATKNYVDLMEQGLSPKPSAKAATTVALAANTYANGASGVGATLTANANGALAAQDGVTLAANDRLIVKNEATASHNGEYTVTQVGDASNPYILTRIPEMDSSTEISGAYTFVESGTVNGGTTWATTNLGSVIVGTDSITYTQTSGPGSFTFNAPLSSSGTSVSANLSARIVNSGGNFDLASGVVTTGTYGSVTVDTYGRVTAGSIATPIANGGTAQTTAAAARGTSGIGAATAPAGATNVTVSAKGIGTMVTATLTGTGAATAFTVTHNLNNSTPIVGDLWDASGNRYRVQTIITDANTVTITFNTAPANGVTYTVTVMG